MFRLATMDLTNYIKIHLYSDRILRDLFLLCMILYLNSDLSSKFSSSPKDAEYSGCWKKRNVITQLFQCAGAAFRHHWLVLSLQSWKTNKLPWRLECVLRIILSYLNMGLAKGVFWCHWTWSRLKGLLYKVDNFHFITYKVDNFHISVSHKAREDLRHAGIWCHTVASSHLCTAPFSPNLKHLWVLGLT